MLLPLRPVLQSQGMFPTCSEALLKVASGTSDGPVHPQLFQGIVCILPASSPASIPPSTHASSPPSRLAPVCHTMLHPLTTTARSPN